MSGRRHWSGGWSVRSTVPKVLLALLSGLVAVPLLPATPAAAHAYLSDSDPPGGAVLPSAPAQVVLTFSEPVQPVPDRIIVVNPDGEQVSRGEPEADGPVITIPLAGDGPRGTYLVSYRVTSVDGHPISGALTYSVGAPSATPPLPSGGGDGGGAAGAALTVVKYLGYAGLVLLVGATAVLLLLWPRRLPRRGAARLLWAGAGLVAASTLATLWLQVPYTTGGSVLDVTGAGLRDVLGTSYGRAHLVRLGVLAAAVALLRQVTAGRATRTDVAGLGLLGLVGLGTWPVAGHAVSAPLSAVGVVAGTVHLAAVTFWIGGLVVLATFLLRRADARELSAILPAWSRWAATAVAALLVAGVVRAVLEIGTLPAVLSTGYGRLLLVKVGLVALVVAVAWFSRRLVRRGAAGGGRTAGPPDDRATSGREGRNPRVVLRTSVLVEAGLLAGVLALSSVLVQTTPARTEAAAARGGSDEVTVDYFTTTLETDLYSLEVIIDPAAVGANTVHLYAYDDVGRPLRVFEWRARASLPDAGVTGVEVPVEQIGDNHALGEVALPLAGEWDFQFTARTSEIDQASVRVTVPVDGGG